MVRAPKLAVFYARSAEGRIALRATHTLAMHLPPRAFPATVAHVRKPAFCWPDPWIASNLLERDRLVRLREDHGDGRTHPGPLNSVVKLSAPGPCRCTE